MSLKMTHLRVKHTFATLLAAAATFAAHAADWNITDLGTLGGSMSFAGTINNAGQITGSARIGNEDSHAFLYSNGSMTDLGTLGGRNSWATINDAGQIVGTSELPGGGNTHPFRYANGAMSDIADAVGVGDFSSAGRIGDAGQMLIGQAEGINIGNNKAFVYSNNVLTDLGSLGGGNTNAEAINSAGQIVGGSTLASGKAHAFLYVNSAMTDLGAFAGGLSIAMDINNAGQIVGYSTLAPDGNFRAFLYQDGQMTSLLGNSGPESFALALNNTGQIVGYRNGNEGFLYQNSSFTELGTLAAVLAGGWSNLVPNDINDQGQIVGYGSHGGYTHAFLLSPATGPMPPVPEPATWMTMMLGLVGMVLVVRRMLFPRAAMSAWNWNSG